MYNDILNLYNYTKRSGPSESYSFVTRFGLGFESPEFVRRFPQRIMEMRRGLSGNIFTSLEDLDVIIGEKHVKKGALESICKELFALGNETTQLPRLHLYHGQCIVPWLSARNSCPLCRFELPTDDKDYEEHKQNVVDVSEDRSSSDDDVRTERGESEADDVSRVRRRRWLFPAAAQVASLVGVVLAMWLSNPQRRDIVISHSQREKRTRRWMPFFSDR
ncbi:unnamed protein product [Brassica oleracea]|uniref:RING-type E3 ubiquitin transferase n=2 Tax=Brassica TaxID=3705 RepID=A0A816KPI0_BRANA|nr:unnamed protein product [Brassica napus]VDD44446.1 unnamed protein product [Brassica oleracea]